MTDTPGSLIDYTTKEAITGRVLVDTIFFDRIRPARPNLLVSLDGVRSA